MGKSKSILFISSIVFVLPVIVVSGAFADTVIVEESGYFCVVLNSTGASTCYHAFGIFAPDSFDIADTVRNHLGDTLFIGYFPAGTELVFFIRTMGGVCGFHQYFSNDPSRCHILYLGTNRWQLRFEDWTDGSFDDVVADIFQCSGIHEIRATIIEPLSTSWTSCSDQGIIMHISSMITECSGEFLSDSGEVPDVLLLGYWDGDGDPLGDAGLSGINPSEGDVTLGNVWTRGSTHLMPHPEMPNVVGIDFTDIWPGSNRMAYLHFYICSPDERDIYLVLMTDDDLMVWLDGDSIYAEHSHVIDDPDTITVHLSAGYHSFLFWVCNYLTHYWWVKWRFVDELGAPITDLYYAVDSLEATATASSCPIDTTSIDFTVEGVHYSVGEGYLTFTDDSVLTWTPIPPDTFEDGDTVSVCLMSADDTCGGTLELPVCWNFYVDLTPPAIWGISPPPDSVVFDSLSSVRFCIFDSLSGLDTSTIEVSFDGTLAERSITWVRDHWVVVAVPESSLTGDSVRICISATDTTDYCEDNILDTCFTIYIEPCPPADAWVICPLPCESFSSCSTQVMIFGFRDSMGGRIDTMRVYFTIRVVNRTAGTDSSYILSEPTDFIEFTDDTIATVWGNWSDRDSVIISLDSLYTTSGCLTVFRGCHLNSDCDEPDEFCRKATGNCDGPGICVERPTICPSVWDPVCGCDGRTYANECVAHSSGVNVLHWGECSK